MNNWIEPSDYSGNNIKNYPGIETGWLYDRFLADRQTAPPIDQSEYNV